MITVAPNTFFFYYYTLLNYKISYCDEETSWKNTDSNLYFRFRIIKRHKDTVGGITS